MNSAELLQKGRLEDALLELQKDIRNKPEDAALRVYLFQLNCLLGRLDKALSQLQALSSLTADTMLLAQVFRPVITCEMLRREVFAGKRTPLVFGEPTEWVGLLVQANSLIAQRNFTAAAELRQKAFESAPATSGKVNETAFEWIADADSRLGPIFEMMFEGKYYWVPVARVQRLEIHPPEDLRDLVWAPALVRWTNGGEVSCHLPSRYPGTESTNDDALKLCRKTDWKTELGDTQLGLGQRLLTTEANEYPLLECRTIELNPAE
ncbi:MAG TPA: type VI secretion system accessory protein TagJ [Verrucomicrobiae bacterium]|nr:type VI secretion system accessory protein TagJ [Verrucomicrobiae bacterium]